MTQLSLEVDKFCCPLLLMLTLSCAPFPSNLSLPLPLSLSPARPLSLLLSSVLFLSPALLSLGRGNLLLLLSLLSIRLSNQPTKQPSIQQHISSISAPLCVGVGVLESCILTGQRQVVWNYIALPGGAGEGRSREVGLCW